MEQILDVSKMLAEMVTGEETRNIQIMPNMPSGSGMSFCGMSILWNAARRIAQLQEEQHPQWNSYFNRSTIAEFAPHELEHVTLTNRISMKNSKSAKERFAPHEIVTAGKQRFLLHNGVMV